MANGDSTGVERRSDRTRQQADNSGPCNHNILKRSKGGALENSGTRAKGKTVPRLKEHRLQQTPQIGRVGVGAAESKAAFAAPAQVAVHSARVHIYVWEAK